jgi:hypothetical protein
MKSLTTLTVKEAVESGVLVCLTEYLDFWFGLLEDGVYNDIAFSIVATDISQTYDITQKQAQDVARFSLNKMGVTI